MAERGNSKHGPILDEKMQQETRGLTNAAQSPHAEDWRETEPVPDETDSPEVQDAFTRGNESQRRADEGAGEDDDIADAQPESGEEP